MLESRDEIGARSPRVERIGRHQTGVEPRGDCVPRRRRERRERHTGALREIDEHFAFAAGVVNRNERPGTRAAAGGEKQQRARELVERLDADDTVAIEQRVVGEIAAGHRARMRQRGGSGGLGAAQLQRDNGDTAIGRFFKRRAEARRVACRFEEEADHLHLGSFQRVVDVIGGGGRQFRSGRHRERQSQSRIVVRECAEHAARMHDDCNGSSPWLARARKAADPDVIELVVEAHAVAAADRYRGGASHRGEPRCEWRRAVIGEVARREDHRRARTHGDRLGERVFEAIVPDRQHRQIGWRRQISQARHAGIALDLVVVGIDRVHRAAKATSLQHPHHVVAGRVGLAAGTDERDRARGEQWRERMRSQGE